MYSSSSREGEGEGEEEGEGGEREVSVLSAQFVLYLIKVLEG